MDFAATPERNSAFPPPACPKPPAAAAGNLLAIPLGLTATPVLRPERMHALGEDNAALLPDDRRPAAE